MEIKDLNTKPNLGDKDILTLGNFLRVSVQYKDIKISIFDSRLYLACCNRAPLLRNFTIWIDDMIFLVEQRCATWLKGKSKVEEIQYNLMQWLRDICNTIYLHAMGATG